MAAAVAAKRAATRGAAASAATKTRVTTTAPAQRRRSSRVKKEESVREETDTKKEPNVKQEARVKQETPDMAKIKTKEEESPRESETGKRRIEATQSSTPSRKKVKIEKAEDQDDELEVKPTTASKKSSPPASKNAKDSSALLLQTAKLKKYAQLSTTSPYPPTFTRPTPSDCDLAVSILSSQHGTRQRPSELKASSVRAGCGDSPSVLDALVRTILSQNTSDRNSSAAKRSMDAAYGGSDNWEAIAAGGPAKLQSAIQCGGLAATKSRVILTILEQVRARHGAYSLDHLHAAATDEAFTTLLGFQGVGPKTASCVVLFCLGRDSFAVDTHVFRIAKLLGWVPRSESDRERAQAHLEATVPPEHKYPLHVLLVTHGKVCPECRAGGRAAGKGEERCKLREAFSRRGGGGDGVGHEIKDEDD